MAVVLLAGIEETRNACIISVVQSLGKWSLGRPRRCWGGWHYAGS